MQLPSATLLAEVLYLSYRELGTPGVEDTSPLSQGNTHSFVMRPRSQGMAKQREWNKAPAWGGDKSAWQAFYLKEIAFSTFFTLRGELQKTRGPRHGKKHNKQLNNQEKGLLDTLHAAGAPGQRQVRPEVAT